MGVGVSTLCDNMMYCIGSLAGNLLCSSRYLLSGYGKLFYWIRVSCLIWHTGFPSLMLRRQAGFALYRIH